MFITLAPAWCYCNVWIPYHRYTNQRDQMLNLKFAQIWGKVAQFNMKEIAFYTSPKYHTFIWASFDRHIVIKNFQKSPNLVILTRIQYLLSYHYSFLLKILYFCSFELLPVFLVTIFHRKSDICDLKSGCWWAWRSVSFNETFSSFKKDCVFWKSAYLPVF